jgi:ParB family chromosome partitioning protein
MNAMTQNETQALEGAALEVADPGTNMLLVPLSNLILRPTNTSRNMRKTMTARIPIPTLAASIERVGLLQNLLVLATGDGVTYEVVGGGRRFQALKLLAKKRRISKEWNVPCLLVADGTARTASLTENVQREAMHPADQFEAFAALVAEGRPIEDIAADFSVTPLVVRRRLKLANVSPRLLASYRADEVNLEQLMALAITDDHEAQDRAYFEAPTWQRDPVALRRRLTEREIEADRNPFVRFVGLNAYSQAGGGIHRDLFAEGDAGVYLIDGTLLERLAQEKLESIATDVRAEGWSWTDVALAVTYADLQNFQHAPKQRREPNKREAQRIEKLQGKAQELEDAINAAIDVEDTDQVAALEEESQHLGQQLHDLEESLRDYSVNVKAAAGAIVTVDRDGQTVIHRGLLREAEAKALRALERMRQGFPREETGSDGDGQGGTDQEIEHDTSAFMSDRLTERMSVHRTAALQIQVARHPQGALAAVVHGMVQNVLQDSRHSHDLPLGVQLKVQDRMESMAPDWPDSPAAAALRELQQEWGGKLPQDSEDLFDALLAMEQDELVKLLAVCAASTVDVVIHRAKPRQPGAQLAHAVELDMSAWWFPSAEGFFNHVPKAVILDAVGEFAPDQVTRLGKLKKAEIASEAERLVEGTGWMPAVFRTEGPKETAPEQTPEDAVPDDAQADEVFEPDEALAVAA